jgi:hypothetical protein
MAKLTADQAFDIADAMRASANAIGDFISNNRDSLTPAQWNSLEDEENDLFTLATRIRNSAVGLVLDETQPSVDDITGATQKATQALQTIKTVKQIISISTSLVSLAAAITSGQPSAIVGAIGDLTSSISGS